MMVGSGKFEHRVHIERHVPSLSFPKFLSEVREHFSTRFGKYLQGKPGLYGFGSESVRTMLTALSQAEIKYKESDDPTASLAEVFNLVQAIASSSKNLPAAARKNLVEATQVFLSSISSPVAAFIERLANLLENNYKTSPAQADRSYIRLDEYVLSVLIANSKDEAEAAQIIEQWEHSDDRVKLVQSLSFEPEEDIPDDDQRSLLRGIDPADLNKQTAEVVELVFYDAGPSKLWVPKFALEELRSIENSDDMKIREKWCKMLAQYSKLPQNQ